MTESLRGVTPDDQRELAAMLLRLSKLWADLTAAAAKHDALQVDAIRAEIAVCRGRLEEIRRSGTAGSA